MTSRTKYELDFVLRTCRALTFIFHKPTVVTARFEVTITDRAYGAQTQVMDLQNSNNKQSHNTLIVVHNKRLN
jgi:hypothetical protein